MAITAPIIVDHGSGSSSRGTEKTIAATGTIYMNADAFSDPNFMVV